MTTKETKQENKVAAAVAEQVEKTVEPERQNRYVEVIDDKTIKIKNQTYYLVTNHREGFDAEQLDERYSDILGRYDYIVGDIGFEQLRLRGFHGNQRKKTPLEQRIGALQDYLYEYCNFGCAYFVLEKAQQPQQKKVQESKPAYTKEKKTAVQDKQNTKQKATIKNNRPKNKQKEATSKNKQNPSTKRGFTIRQTDEEE